MAALEVVVAHHEDSEAVAAAPPLASQSNGELSNSDVSVPNDASSSLAMAIHRKVRCCFATLERRLRPSAHSGEDEDASALTIEFLRARLQAQRAEFKAEKQRAQQLAERVLELEQRLELEIKRRNKITSRVAHELDASTDDHHAFAVRLADRKSTKVSHRIACKVMNGKKSLTSKWLPCPHYFLDMNETQASTSEKYSAKTLTSPDSLSLSVWKTLTLNAKTVDENGDLITKNPFAHSI